MISILFLSLAAVCYAVKTYLTFHNTDKRQADKYNFWGTESWNRKYKKANIIGQPLISYNKYAAPDNLYYSFFDIKYREKFPWSATALVFVTDGYHLVQWFMIKFIILAMTVSYGTYGFSFDWIEALLLWGAWTFVFSVVYARMKKR